MKSSEISVLMLLLVCWVVACGDGTSDKQTGTDAPQLPEETEQVSYTLPSTTKYVSAENEAAVLSIQDDGATIVLVGDSALATSIKTWDVLMFGVTSQTPNGLLRKVSTRSQQGANVVLETEQATIPEAFKKLNLTLARSVPYDDMQSYETSLNGLELRRFPLSIEGSAGGTFEVDFDGTVLYDHDGNKSTTGDQVVADGSISFTLGLTLEAETEWFSLKRVKVGTNVFQTGTLTIATSLPTLDFNRELVVADLYFGAFAVGPVVITPNLELLLGANGELQAEVATSITETVEVSSGVVYQNASWTPYSDFASDWGFDPPSLSASARVKAYVGPRLNLMLYGVAGPCAQVDGYLELEADISETPWWELFVGLEAYVGVKGEILGKELVNYQSVDLLGFRKLLAAADGGQRCFPDCSGLDCGDGGCPDQPTVCGVCDAGEYCEQGQCVEGVCHPNCDGKKCGSDGCGGTCGECISAGCLGTKYRPPSDCVGGNCTEVVIVECEDDQECTSDECNESIGCLSEPLTGTQCTDADVCTLADHCQNGQCVGTPVDCDDDNPCTIDKCTPSQGCAYQDLNSGECADGDPCTVADYCVAGECVGDPVVCNDDNPCTVDSCNTVGGCTFDAISSGECVDGDLCTVGDHCEAGVCVGSEIQCDDDNPCTSDSCNEQTGSCIIDEFPDGTACPGGANYKCEGGVCTCVPQCQNKECGNDGCGGICGSCLLGWACDDGQCVNQCTDTCASKGWECSEVCGEDCGTCPEQHSCVGGQCVCQPLCAGKECGDDGCGGSCGECIGQDKCKAFKCVCQPACFAKDCGPDGCGGACGVCSGQTECIDGQCLCQPACDGKDCGSDGCGGSCGSCLGQDECEAFQCVCQPACQGKECGVDGCGGTCGTCIGQDECVGGQCVCQPLCVGKECGSDGCGGSCGSCSQSETCEGGVCVSTSDPTWVDPTSGLMWENTFAGPMDWPTASQYCDLLDLAGYSDWRLPTIGELRSLIRGCAPTEVSGDCSVDEPDCVASACWSSPCNGCSLGEGPADGCYWPDETIGVCYVAYWSTTAVEDLDERMWYVGFGDGSVYHLDLVPPVGVRCVR